MTAGIVGGVVGALALLPASSGATSFENTGNVYTIAIGGLPFNVAPTDENPYQRATAQFRKQQFDSSPTPGDQSLDGMWLRGQFSFHRGAGVKYYEALDGDAVDSRFRTSIGVDPWTPGEAALARRLVSASVTNIVDAASRDGYVFGVSSSNTVHKITAASATVLTSGVATTIDANDQGQTFITAADKIQVATTANFSDLITQTDGNTFVKVAWAKGRLFMVDTTGRWYTKPGSATGSVVIADAFWNSGLTSAVGEWSVAESPSAVYLGRGSSIYSVIPSGDGSVPTLAAPVVAATLPPGETVKALGHSLGWLVIVSDAGVRVARSSDSGQLEMGPVLVEFDASTCRKVGLWKNLAYCTGRVPGDSDETVYMLDLSQVLSSDVVAHARRSTIEASTGSGACFPSGLLAVFSAAGVSIESATDFETAGSLTTGFIRFGTMEPKAYHSLRVKINGNEGSLAISTVEVGEAETLLTTIPSTRFHDQEVSLNLPAPLEALGIKFTFIPGPGGTGPTLLGYQLRALPAPSRRTRMISLPLLCYDDEQTRNGVTIKGSSYERLSALEQMETSAGVVVFQDFRTGEQAECFVEEVSFMNRTAPKGTAGNFGGIVNVTLRKLT